MMDGQDGLELVRRLLEARVILNQDLAARTGLMASTISLIRRGHTRTPLPGTTLRLVVAAKDLLRERVYQGDRRAIESLTGKLTDQGFIGAAVVVAGLRARWADPDDVIRALSEFGDCQNKDDMIAAPAAEGA